MKHGKKYTEALKGYDRQNLYDMDEAVGIVKKTAVAKFDETIEAHIRTGCDGRHADQRSAALSFFRTVQASLSAFSYLQRAQRLMRPEKPEQIMSARWSLSQRSRKRTGSISTLLSPHRI